jgi:hypothetical protein
MNPKIRFCVVIAYALAAPVMGFYAWLFMHLLEPSLPLIPICAAICALGAAGAAGWHLAELFADMERIEQ